MGIDGIGILFEPDDAPIVRAREFTVDELHAIRSEHEQGVHDRSKMVCCSLCFPPKS